MTRPITQVVADQYPKFTLPLEMTCQSCGKVQVPPVGRVVFDHGMAANRDDPDWIDQAWACTGYFHCVQCGAPGPWSLTPSGRIALMAATMTFDRHAPGKAPVQFGKLTLFDGTTVRWGSQAVAHLQDLIARSPDDYYLYGRLGNTYRIAERSDLALEAFRRAVERNPHDVDSHHSIGDCFKDEGNLEEAVAAFHRVLVHAHQAPARTPRQYLREIVRDALIQLVDIHVQSNRRLPILPVQAPGAGVVAVSESDLRDPEVVERLVERWVTGKEPPVRPGAKATASSKGMFSQGGKTRTGRNDPCPCGSGKKYKNCCLHG